MTSIDTCRKKRADYIINHEFPKYNELLVECFDFDRWGFRMIFSGDVPQSHPSIVYESEYCRVKFMWEIPDERDSSEITYILYGRQHAPVLQETMMWNSESCRCWHDINLALNFLDHAAPKDALRNATLLKDFYNNNKYKGWRKSEMRARSHAAAWEYYGQSLFDLFDLRRPDLWRNYADFIKEFYEQTITWPDHSITPLYKVC